jgi:hypothetical protein
LKNKVALVTGGASGRVGKEDTPENAARHIVKGIIKKKPFLVLTFIGKLSYLVSRLFPLLFEYIMTRQLKKEL